MNKSGLPVSQGDLYLLLPLAWQAYTDHLSAFAEYKSGYTEQLATTQRQALADAQALPDDSARSGQAEAVRQQLVPQLAEYLAAWQRLDGYIEEAFPDSYDTMRNAAGHGSYEAASQNDWASVTTLLAAARTFGEDHEAELLAKGQMPATFLTKILAAEAADVTRLLGEYQQLKGTAQQGTTTQQTANRALYDDYQKMNRDAQRIFRRQPDIARLFQTEYLLGLVRGPGQAGLRGTLTLADGTLASGITVAVQGPKGPVETVSDAEGRYALPIPAGDYTLVFSGAGVARQEVPVTVAAGVKKRVDGVLGQEAVN
ncbi:carboxypeptidase-like regulatory domain-containing protein [Hymenobacter terricola]|uniref:carboxypeptidase-like regulatory domain-containing protein n=1 Tax=Hymenobacter terricola TaxID=2819236 RepID=UPI001B315221|nr:carboxypeptidase-like regulatory domain-containing protein [Hymenobacter terricola]